MAAPNVESYTSAGTMNRSIHAKIKIEDEVLISNKSFSEKWAQLSDLKKRQGTDSKLSAYISGGLLAFQVPTQLYAFLHTIIPYLFSEYDEWTRYYLKVLVCFCCLEGIANYLCCLLYDASVSRSKDRPNIDGSHSRWSNPPEHFLPLYEDNGKTEKNEWIYCENCDKRVPPRAYHCKRCRQCILKRDHHCLLIGKCIGFKNQRYFVVLTFYTAVIGLLGGFFTHQYLRHAFWPISGSWTDFLLPVTFYRMMSGSVSIGIGILIYHVYMEYIFGIWGLLYFCVQISIIVKGLTLFEIVKHVSIRSFSSPNENFVSVFGHFWLLNFIFPMQIIFKQIDDGMKWDKIKMHTRYYCLSKLDGSNKEMK